ncbi:helix-turn-helix domain-containing protein [Pseudoalteromonas luteoviolacea]|uniref:helix-turn-helix domain-containing protein n=1 Tax=Pseudoalteromonas luteoviolacea TaxID=43657 RepID=UPI0011513553|nr:helix-turn-helix transcriptional regulator [Pseudoalteromonas luteoviolacea]TQF69572.1 helix-turn-helix transcriptional regulator [Pseudoalteromonas luteoviolacea]
MNSDQRKQAIQEKGYSLQMIADAMGRSISTISNVVSGRDVSAPTANAICKIVGIPVQTFFADCDVYSKAPTVVRGKARKDKVAELREILATAS